MEIPEDSPYAQASQQSAQRIYEETRILIPQPLPQNNSQAVTGTYSPASLYVSAVPGGPLMTIILDSGADSPGISPRFLECFEHTVYNHDENITIKGISGDVVLTQWARLYLYVKGQKADGSPGGLAKIQVDASIMNDFDCTMLVGTSWLEPNMCVINYCNRIMTLGSVPDFHVPFFPDITGNIQPLLEWQPWLVPFSSWSRQPHPDAPDQGRFVFTGEPGAYGAPPSELYYYGPDVNQPAVTPGETINPQALAPPGTPVPGYAAPSPYQAPTSLSPAPPGMLPPAYPPVNWTSCVECMSHMKMTNNNNTNTCFQCRNKGQTSFTFRPTGAAPQWHLLSGPPCTRCEMHGQLHGWTVCFACAVKDTDLDRKCDKCKTEIEVIFDGEKFVYDTVTEQVHLVSTNCSNVLDTFMSG